MDPLAISSLIVATATGIYTVGVMRGRLNSVGDEMKRQDEEIKRLRDRDRHLVTKGDLRELKDDLLREIRTHHS